MLVSLISLTYGTNSLTTLRATDLVLMYSGIVNGYQLLGDALTVLQVLEGIFLE